MGINSIAVAGACAVLALSCPAWGTIPNTGLEAYLPFDTGTADVSAHNRGVAASGSYEITGTWNVTSDKDQYGVGTVFSASGMLGGNFFRSTGGGTIQIPDLSLGESTFSYTGWIAAHPNQRGGPFLGNANVGKGWYTHGWDNGGLATRVNDGTSMVATLSHDSAGSNSGYWNWRPIVDGGEYDVYWYFLAGVFDFQAGTIDLYVGATRSVLQATGTRPVSGATMVHQQFSFDPNAQNFSSGNGVMAGFNDNWPYAYANRVNLDDLSFWSRALADDEILQLWNNGSGAALSSLLTGNPPAPGPHMGDANGDKKVDLQDFSMLKGHYNQTGSPPWEFGNFNRDEKVDLQDFSLLKAHYNHTGDENTVPATAAPEPASAAGALAALAVLARRRRR